MTKMKRSVLASVLIAWLLAGWQRVGTLPTTGDYQPSMRYFDRAMIRLIQKWEIPGGALAVIQDEEIVLARGYGYADVESSDLVEPDSLFRIASVSKPITAVAVLKLVEEGLLSLDAPAFQLLEDLLPGESAEVDLRIYNITTRHLLEHTGGWDANVSFDPMFMARQIAEEMGTPAPADCATIIRYMLGQPLDFDPGSQSAYSNYGYCVLGRVIEKVSGQTYKEYVQSHILEPAGIVGMRLGCSRFKDRYPGEVHYYDPESMLTNSVFPEILKAVPRPYGGFYLEAMDAHGGWIASAVDLARFAAALERMGSTAILKEELLAVIYSRPESSGYAYGLRVRPAGESTSWWSNGFIPGSTAILYRTSDGLIWAALFNTSPAFPGDDFLVAVISAMGQAAFMGKLLWVSALVLLVVASVVLFLVIRNRKIKKKL